MHPHWHNGDREDWQFSGGGQGRGWGRQGGRSGRGFGGGFGGRAFRVGKMLADGDLRIVVLALLNDGPRHGYDIIKALEERSQGIYSPSPGVVYPTLTYLEEVGYVSASAEGNKKVYALTDSGKAYLEENREVADMVLDGLDKFARKVAKLRGWWEDEKQGRKERDRDIPGVLDEVNDARRDLKAAIAEALQDAGEDVQRRIARAMRDSAAAIRKAMKSDVIDL
jgi:DNA-binding PadR family transcriptional regulator